MVSAKEGESLGAIIQKRDEVYRQTGDYAYILVHSRCHPDDVNSALRYKIDGFNFYMGTSEESQRFNHGKHLDDVAKISSSIIRDLRKTHPDLLIRFSGEDAFRTEVEDLFRVYDTLKGLVDRFGMPDTVGVGKPDITRRIVSFLSRRYGIPLEGHFQDDNGLSLANALAGIESGMEFIDTTILGLAERSGLTSMTALALNLYETDQSLLDGYDYSQSYPLNVRFADIVRIDVPWKEPVSLTNRTHSAGVHTQAVQKNKSVYEGHPLEKFGVTESAMLLGPQSGRHTIHYFLTRLYYYDGVTDELAQRITERYKQKTGIPYQDAGKLLREIAENEFGLRSSASPDYFENLGNGLSVVKF